jgi:hypothetical protein
MTVVPAREKSIFVGCPAVCAAFSGPVLIDACGLRNPHRLRFDPKISIAWGIAGV